MLCMPLACYKALILAHSINEVASGPVCVCTCLCAHVRVHIYIEVCVFVLISTYMCMWAYPSVTCTIHGEMFGTGKNWRIVSHSPKFFSPIFTNVYALTVAYSPNFSSPIASTCIVRQNFSLPNIPCVR